MLTLEEARKKQQHGQSQETAMLHNAPPPPPPGPPRPSEPPTHSRSDGRNSRSRGRGGSSRGGRTRQTPRSDVSASTPAMPRPLQWSCPPWAYWPPPQWAIPPCPVPTTPWGGPPVPRASAGILGPRPAQAYAATPTDIQAAMHTMSLSPPDDNWYMDTGATSHMTSSSGSPHGGATSEV
ncbi:unnamed protein product [Cuscuta epithymum]|uniref:Uncharacterized protein n=1 Tax=Cuscuta epithymum TaxID=186058 RepID=A0AAV0F5U7_9ASTE|nr:unnamed protein product [Cuscuta epithymum]